MDPLDMW